MITTLIGALLFALVLTGLVRDTARLCTLSARHRPSLARLGGGRPQPSPPSGSSPTSC